MIQTVLAHNQLWQLVVQSDRITIAILLVLFGCSVISWTLFGAKILFFSIKKHHIAKCRFLMKNAKTLDDMHRVSGRLSGTLPGYFIEKNLLFFRSHVQQVLFEGPYERKKHLVELMQYHLQNAIDFIVDRQESGLAFFSTIAAVAPLVGLLGTVWGLIHSFLRMSQLKSADITVIAPGMAQALIVTFAGLLVAIPALLMCNYCLSESKSIENGLQSIADRIESILLDSII